MNNKRGGGGGPSRGGGGYYQKSSQDSYDKQYQGSRRGGHTDGTRGGQQAAPNYRGNARGAFGGGNTGYEEEKTGQHRVIHDTSLSSGYQKPPKEENIYEEASYGGNKRRGGNFNYNEDPTAYPDNYNQQQNTYPRGGHQIIRGLGRGQSSNNRGNQEPYSYGGIYNEQYDSGYNNPNDFQPAGKGRGRGRGSSYQIYGGQEFVPSTNQGRGYSAGYGRGRPVYEQYDTYQNNDSYSYQQQNYVQAQPPPFAQYLQSAVTPQSWVSDFRGVDYSHPNQQEEEPSHQGLSGNFRPGPPGVIHYAKQPKTREQRGIQSHSQKSQITAAQDQFLRQQQDHRNSQEDLLEDRVIQDKRQMNICFGYKEYPQPGFFQGPTFVIYKEQSKIKNHRYPEDKDDPDEEHCYDVVQFPPLKVRSFPPPKLPRSRKTSEGGGAPPDARKKKVETQDALVFDIKTEKKKGNKFWKDTQNQNGSQQKPAKAGGRGTGKGQSLLIYKRGEASGNDSKKNAKKGAKNASRDKGSKGHKGNKERVNFEQYLQVEEEIKKGIQEGKLFEGLLRVNPNNRNRAFVTIDGVPIDVMIDGLGAQNRALDGDTVVISLVDPSRWPSQTQQNVIIGSKKESAGFTNETAIETRVIDVERGSSHHEDHQSSSIPLEPLTQPSSQSPAKLARGKKTNMLGESEDSGDNLPEVTPQEAHEDSSSSSSATSSEEEEEEEKEIDALIELEEDRVDGGRFAKDEVVGDSDEEDLYDDDEESIEEDAEKERPRNPFKQPKEKSEYIPHKAKGQQHRHQQAQKTASQFGNGKSKAEIVQMICEYAKDSRPLGRVKAILKSPNREKDHMVTLIIQDKERLEDESFIKLLAGQISHGKKGGQESTVSSKVAMNCGIFAIPISKKLPWMSLTNIPPELIDDLKNQRKPQNRYYIAKFESWNVGYIRPVCSIIEHIGEAGNLNAESLRILKTHDIWSDEYEAEGQKLNEKVHESLRVFTKNLDPVSGEWKIPEEEIKLRRDLRQKRIFTIDPLTAKDLDDALSIDKITDSIYEIGVHIADVSYFVQQGTELDKEAQLRCTSVYFVHKVYPMLPRLLCERLCSLNPQVDRLSYSIFFRLDINTGELDRSFTPVLQRTVMRSCAKWNYQLVQDILDKKITSVDQLEEQYRPKEQKFEDMVNDCFLMHQIAQKRRAQRFENGSIMMQNREFMFKLDQSSQLPLSFIESKTRMPSKHLVEEYMLLANILVAEHLYKRCTDKTLLRAHPDLDTEKKEKLLEFFEKAGMKGVLDLTNSKTVSYSLEVLRSQGDSSKFNVAMRKFLTCLQCAKYMCINGSDPSDYQHFGLNFPLYTHFTSPIRRYADLLVHRLVTLTLTHGDKTRELIDQMDYTEYAEQCSEKSLNAKRASTQCTRLFHCLLLKQQGIRVYDTLLFDMEQSGTISIYIDEINMHHKVRLRDDTRIDSVIFFEDQLILVAHLKQPSLKDGKRVNNGERVDAFRQVTKYSQIHEFAPEELLVFKIFDKIKVKVDTTTEFPLDIKCSLVIDKDDHEEFNKLAMEQEAALIMAEGAKRGQEAPRILGSVVEIENLDAEV